MPGRNSCRNNFGGKGGRGIKNNNNNDRQNESTKKNLQDFTFYVGSAKQAINHENTALFVINHIQKYFDKGRDIAEYLREL